MAYWNPFKNLNVPSLTGAATSCFLITPDDDNELPKAVKGLRVYNSAATAATIRFDTIDGDTVTLDFPATTLVYEDIAVSKVYETGTTATDLTIHGLSD